MERVCFSTTISAAMMQAVRLHTRLIKAKRRREQKGQRDDQQRDELRGTSSNLPYAPMFQSTQPRRLQSESEMRRVVTQTASTAPRWSRGI